MRSLLLLLLGVLAATPSHACDDLRGRWESETRTRTGLGQVFEFTGTGVVYVTLSGIADSNFVLEGDRLSSNFVDPKEPTRPIKITYQLRMDGETLIMKELASGNEQTMVRVGRRAADDKPIYGIWKWKHASGLEASTRFTSDGQMLTRLPIKTEKGTYQCVSGSLSLEVAGRKKETRSYRLEQGMLVLGSLENSGEKRFRPAQ